MPVSVTALRSVERAMTRSAAMVHEDLAAGLSGLATIASTSFFFGILGSIWGIIYSFTGLGTERSTGMAILAASLSTALWSTAFALLLAVMATAFHRYLQHRLADFELQMRNMTTETVSVLARYPQHALEMPPELSRESIGSSQKWFFVGV